MAIRLFILVIGVILTTSSVFAQLSNEYKRGIQSFPCRQPIPSGHQLTLDFGQICHYDYANSQLPTASDQRVVYFGDSLTEGWGARIPGLRDDDVINRGISGQTTAQMLVRFRADVINLHPRIVHLLMGTNDIAGNTGATSMRRIQDAIASMAEQARDHGIRVVLASILPAAKIPWRAGIEPGPAIREMNRWLRVYAKTEGFTYVDYYSALVDGQGGFKSNLAIDGVHPNVAGYDVMRPLAIDALGRANR